MTQKEKKQTLQRACEVCENPDFCYKCDVKRELNNLEKMEGVVMGSATVEISLERYTELVKKEALYDEATKKREFYKEIKPVNKPLMRGNEKMSFGSDKEDA